MRIIERVLELGLPQDDYAVFGSAWLDYWNLREASDLDILVTPRLFRKLRQTGEWSEIEANGFAMLTKGDACVTSEQWIPTDGDYCPDRLALIREAEIVDGVPFVRIEEVIKCKQAYNRPKDQSDIRMIMQYLGVR